jgi:hypothetical protein
MINPMSLNRRRVLAVFAYTALAGCAGGFRGSGGSGSPTAWSAHTPGSTVRVDHRAWAIFLSRHTVEGADGITRVGYAGVPNTDRELLDQYIAGLSGTDLAALSRSEQLAFWINLYNALLVRLVLDHVIISSPDEINAGGPFSTGPWERTLIRIGGRAVSLAAIKRDALRPTFRDPRWHYALCDGTLGGPSLARTPYTGATIDRDLQDAAIDFISSPRAISFPDGSQALNALWKRDMADFGGSLGGVLGHIRLYATADVRQRLSVSRETRWIDDRRLNESRALVGSPE